ncbi:hypothetical protein DW094_11640 [Ruminococcaceae bacterium AM07-15]|nr:hypothetical protein DW094_11640 [Ruminococcaceae bacterium AM07-15]
MKRRKRSFSRALAGVLAAAMLLPLMPRVEAGGKNLHDVVPDRTLRALINAKLSTVEKPRQATDPISADDMAKLTGEEASELNQTPDFSQGPGMNDPGEISKKGLCSDGLEESQKTIQSLEGLQYAVNLKSLDLSGNQITDLTPLAGLTNLTYLDLSDNQITDLTPLEGFLERMNKGADYFAWLVAQKAPDWNIPVLKASPEGEAVPVPDSDFKAIGQLAELKNDQVTFDQSVEISAVNLKGVSADFTEDQSIEVEFAKRLYQPLEEEDLALTISGKGTKENSQKFHYILQATVNLRQDSLYQVSLDYQEDFLIIDTTKGKNEPVTVTGTIRRTDGEQVELQSISAVELSEYTSELSFVEATDVQCSGNTFSFQVKLKDANRNWTGAQYLTPEITYTLADGTQETMPAKTAGFLFFVGDPSGLKVDRTITFHMDQVSNGEITSQPVHLEIPGETVNTTTTLYTADIGHILCWAQQQADGTWVFTLPVDNVDRAELLYIALDPDDAGDNPRLYVPVTVQKIYPDDGGGDPLPPSLEQQVKNAQEGSTVKTTLSQGQQVDAKTLEALAGRDVKLEVRTGDVTLRIDGKDVPQDAELPPLTARGVLDGDAVPQETVEGLSAGLFSRTLSLEGQEEFGYPVTVLLSLAEQKGQYLNLYRYEENSLYGPGKGKMLVFQQSALVPEDGKVELRLEQGGDYVMLFDQLSHETPFLDVSRDDWFQEDVRFVWRMGWMEGMENGDFAPNQTLTRAQLMQILYNQAGCPEVAGQGDFSDVAEISWYFEAVQWGAQQGVTQGYEDGSFRPNEPISRQQLAVMLYRFHQGAEGGSLEGFADAGQVASWAEEAMEWAVGQGIVGGMEGDMLAPQGNATRAQSAAVLCRLAQK